MRDDQVRELLVQLEDIADSLRVIAEWARKHSLGYSDNGDALRTAIALLRNEG